MKTAKRIHQALSGEFGKSDFGKEMANFADNVCDFSKVEGDGGLVVDGKRFLATVSQELAGVKLTQSERLTRLNEIAIRQMKVLTMHPTLPKLMKKRQP